VAKRTQKKSTPAQVKKQKQRIIEVIEEHRRKSREEHFISLTPEEIEHKLKRVNSPMIAWQSLSSVAPGGTFNYIVGIVNPDPVNVNFLFVHVWIGSGNVDPAVSTFLLNVDPRFPRLTQPDGFAGLSLASEEPAELTFLVKIPARIQKGAYLLNSVLMKLDYFGVGQFLDRATSAFPVI
jgi:hypothetical protein